MAGYSGDFSGLGNCLYRKEVSAFESPVFFVAEVNDSLWITTRGVQNVYDVLTCCSFNETKTEFGTFHDGILKAALFEYNIFKKFIANHTGKVYCTGHSYGGTVAPVIALLARRDFPEREIKSISFAAFPMMDNETKLKNKEHIVAFVNDKDVVPTLSVGDIYETLKLIIPFFKLIDEAWLTSFLENTLEELQPFLPRDIYETVKLVIPELVDALLGIAHGEIRQIRYLPGHVYQIFEGKPKHLADSEIDPTKLNFIQLNVPAFKQHEQSHYLKIMEEMPDNDEWDLRW
jgi:hypothetical protein